MNIIFDCFATIAIYIEGIALKLRTSLLVQPNIFSLHWISVSYEF